MGIEQNEYDDFTCIKNFVFHSDIEDDESGDDKKLTSLVRESYVKRLRQLLKQNYKIWCENDKDESVSGDEKRLSPTEIDRCITFLEDKALQVCMVARIYQKVMVKMMSDIKKSTREMKLFESLIDTKGWIEDRYPDKSTQTETTTKCDNDVQTDPVAFGPRYSLLDLPLPSVNSMASCLEQKTPDSPCKQLKETVAKVMPRVVNRSQDGGGTQKTTDVLTPSRKRRRSSALLDVEVDQNIKLIRRDSVDSFCSDLSSSVAKRDSICGNLSSSMTNLNSVCNTLSSTVTKRDSIRDSLSIKQDSICNNLLSSATNQDSIRDSLSSSVLKQASICDSLSSSLPKRDNKRDSLSSKRDSISSNFSSSEVSLNLMDVSNKPMISNTSLVNSDSLLGADSSLNNELINSSLGIDSSTNIDDNLLSLDARLMEMGLLNIDEQSGDEQSIVAPSPNPGGTRGHRVHKGTWYVEMVAHVCNFHRAYSQLTPDECARIDLRNAQLFGTKRYDRSMKLCDDNLALCRKRIASRVVAELTPFLDKKLIYNRLLFKEFAKRVTESIMDESYAPESSRIKNFVVNFFNRNKSIKSMIDIELCTKEIY